MDGTWSFMDYTCSIMDGLWVASITHIQYPEVFQYPVSGKNLKKKKDVGYPAKIWKKRISGYPDPVKITIQDTTTVNSVSLLPVWQHFYDVVQFTTFPFGLGHGWCLHCLWWEWCDMGAAFGSIDQQWFCFTGHAAFLFH